VSGSGLVDSGGAAATWGKAIDAFDDWLDDQGERPPVVLVMPRT
jgi:hypothetical protein